MCVPEPSYITRKRKAERSFETSVPAYEPTRCPNPEEHHFVFSISHCVKYVWVVRRLRSVHASVCR